MYPEIVKIIEVLGKNPAVEYAVLFGSFAKGSAVSESDVDLLVKVDEELHGLAFFGLLEDLVTATGRQFDLIEEGEVPLGSVVEKEIRETGVKIYERSRCS